MKILRTCPFTKEEKVMDIDVTEHQLEAWRQGELIQIALPHLSADEREFIKTGITPDVWDTYV